MTVEQLAQLMELLEAFADLQTDKGALISGSITRKVRFWVVDVHHDEVLKRLLALSPESSAVLGRP